MIDTTTTIWGYIDPGTGLTVTTAGGIILAFVSGLFGFLIVFFRRIGRFFRRRWSWLLVMFLMAAVAGGVWMMQQRVPTKLNRRVVILGMDALSPRVMQPLLQQGRLPNFVRLREAGGYAPLGTTQPPQSPVAWSSFSTGQNPGKNGVFDFISRRPQDYTLSLSLTQFDGDKPQVVIRSPRFWQYLKQKRVNTRIIGCPITFPPDDVEGELLSGMGVPDILGTEGTFQFFTTEKPQSQETTGGKVFYLNRGPVMFGHIIGPRVASAGGQAEPVKVPLKIARAGDGVELSFQKKTVALKPGEWSEWQDMTFPLGWLRKAHGIFKFHLVAVEPEVQLYVSPINLDPRRPFFPISYPKSYSRDLAAEVGLFHTQGMPFDTWVLNEQRLSEAAFLQQVKDVLAQRERILDHELKRFDDGVFYFYFESPDIIQHMFWRYIDPQHPLYEPDAPAEYRGMIEHWYERMDKILGRVMDELNEEDVLIVLSDHGFDTFRRTVHLNTWLRDNGYLELKDAGAMQGAPLLGGIDWSRTRAYAVGFNGIYINEKGREGQGIVAPGAEKEQLKQEIAARLTTLKDGEADVVRKVYPREEVVWGPYAGDAPDLIVGYNVGFRASWQTALGDVPRDIIEDNLKKWSGSHLFDADLVPGVLFVNRPLKKTAPHIRDLAPTILHLSGFTPEEMKAFDFDGENVLGE